MLGAVLVWRAQRPSARAGKLTRQKTLWSTNRGRQSLRRLDSSSPTCLLVLGQGSSGRKGDPQMGFYGLCLSTPGEQLSSGICVVPESSPSDPKQKQRSWPSTPRHSLGFAPLHRDAARLPWALGPSPPPPHHAELPQARLDSRKSFHTYPIHLIS